jgi:hypothetical protein
MISLDKLRVIAHAKFSRKDNLGTWYQDRLDICSQCPLNSKNKENLSIRDIAIVAANFGKAACLGCGCEIDAKASVREEECGITKLGQEPLWNALPAIEAYNFESLTVENLSSNLINLSTTNLIDMDYGTIKYGSNTEISLSIEGINSPISNLTMHMGCGCTTGITKKAGDKFFTSIKYDSTRLGEFSKTVIFSFNQGIYQGDKLVRVSGRIRGTVIK